MLTIKIEYDEKKIDHKTATELASITMKSIVRNPRHTRKIKHDKGLKIRIESEKKIVVTQNRTVIAGYIK